MRHDCIYLTYIKLLGCIHTWTCLNVQCDCFSVAVYSPLSAYSRGQPVTDISSPNELDHNYIPSLARVFSKNPKSSIAYTIDYLELDITHRYHLQI